MAEHAGDVGRVAVEDLVGVALDHLLLEGQRGLEGLGQREAAGGHDLDLVAHVARRGAQLGQREPLRVDEDVELVVALEPVLGADQVAHQRAVAVLLARQTLPEAGGRREARAVGVVEVADRVFVVGQRLDDLSGPVTVACGVAHGSPCRCGGAACACDFIVPSLERCPTWRASDISRGNARQPRAGAPGGPTWSRRADRGARQASSKPKPAARAGGPSGLAGRPARASGSL